MLMLSMTQAIATLRRKMLTGNFLSAMLELMVPITMTEATHVRRQTMIWNNHFWSFESSKSCSSLYQEAVGSNPAGLCFFVFLSSQLSVKQLVPIFV